MPQTELKDIDVPKRLRLNMAQRSAIADQLAMIAKEKAVADYDSDGIRLDLTKRLIDFMWGDKKTFKTAKKMPEGFFQMSSSISVVLGTEKEHETGANGEKTGYMNAHYAKFALHPDIGSEIIPHKFYHYVSVANSKSKIANKWRESRGFPNITDRKLEKDLFDYLNFETRIGAAKTALKGRALQTLRQINSVKELQESWPAAFEIYHNLFGNCLSGTSLVSAAPISEVTQMIADFPDIEEMMAA